MLAADHVVRLDEIADPTAFLMGARIPLHHPTQDTRYEWISDMLLWRDPPLGWWRDVGVGPLREGIALDCADPAVAPWVDRKIAERRGALSPGGSDSINATAWALRSHMRPDGEAAWRLHYADGTNNPGWLGLGMYLCLDGVAPHEANIPTARAALLRALYGVKK